MNRWIDNKSKPMPENTPVMVRVVKGKGTEDRLVVKTKDGHVTINVTDKGNVSTALAKKLKVLYWLETDKVPE